MNPSLRKLLGRVRRSSVRFGHRLRGYEYIRYAGTVPRSLKICSADSCATCGKRADRKPEYRIIFLLPSDDSAVGGNKVSYQECEIIAGLGSPCFAFHPEKPNFTYRWFPHNVRTLKAGHFDPRYDFLVFSEVWAAVAAEFCVPAGLRYAIYVQNGYITNNTAGFPMSTLVKAYEHAELILSISDDTTAMIKLAYPFLPSHRILRIVYSIPKVFSPGAKERLITYMPRKLRAHSDRLRLYLANMLPGDWRIQAVENLNEAGVAELLSRSSIFLSFSVLEGCPLPPAEAALCGNLVVGYTGEGAKEYFSGPIFREVQNGDFLSFVSQVRIAIADVERGMLDTVQVKAQREALASTFSRENETDRLKTFVAQVRLIMQPSEAPANFRPATSGDIRDSLPSVSNG